MKSIVILCLLGDPMVPPTSEPSRAGGYNVDVKQWLEHLSNTSQNVIVITNQSKHYLSPCEQISPRVTIFRTKIREDSFKNGQALVNQYKSVRKEILGILNSMDIEPVFFHSYYWYNGLFAKNFSVEFGVPFVHTIIDMAAYKMVSGDTLSFKRQYDIEKDIFSEAAYIFAITGAEKKLLLSHYNVSEEKIIVTGREASEIFLNPDHDSYGLSRTCTLSEKELENRFLYTNDDILSKWWNVGAFLYYGRLVEMKGIRYIIKAWHDLYLRYKGDIPPLWIAGGIPSTISSLRKTFDDIPIDSLESNQQLCWWGNLGQKSIRTLMMKSCAVIMHSQHESGGLVVLEALAAGIPVIATDTGFARDIIEDWHTGFKVDYKDTNSLSGRMEHFIRQPLLSRCMGITASEQYRYIQENWHPFNVMDNVYESVYEGNYGKRFVDITTYTGKNCLKQCRLSEIPPYDMMRDWIVHTMNASQNSGVSIDHIVPLDASSSYSDIWRFKSAGKTYIAKRIFSIMNPSRFIISDGVLGFHSIDRFKASVDCMTSKSILQPTGYSEAHHIVILPEGRVADFTSINYLYNAMKLLKAFHSDLLSFTMDNKYQKNTMSQDILFRQLCNHSYVHNSIFLTYYNRRLSALEKYISHEDHRLGIMYGKSVAEHLVYISDEAYMLPSADMQYGDISLDYAITIIDYILSTGKSVKENTYQIIETCADISGIPLQTLCISLALVIAFKEKMQYTLYRSSPNDRTNELWDCVISML